MGLYKRESSSAISYYIGLREKEQTRCCSLCGVAVSCFLSLVPVAVSCRCYLCCLSRHSLLAELQRSEFVMHLKFNVALGKQLTPTLNWRCIGPFLSLFFSKRREIVFFSVLNAKKKVFSCIDELVPKMCTSYLEDFWLPSRGCTPCHEGIKIDTGCLVTHGVKTLPTGLARP